MFRNKKIESRKNKVLSAERNKDAKGSLNSTSDDGPASFDFDCFVATACYGKEDKIVTSLRKWRDEVIQRGTEGNKILFIHAYYSFIGKPGAWVLKKIPFLKPVARKAIKLFVRANKIQF